jgi:hypothetical protein
VNSRRPWPHAAQAWRSITFAGLATTSFARPSRCRPSPTAPLLTSRIWRPCFKSSFSCQGTEAGKLCECKFMNILTMRAFRRNQIRSSVEAAGAIRNKTAPVSSAFLPAQPKLPFSKGPGFHPNLTQPLCQPSRPHALPRGEEVWQVQSHALSNLFHKK